jgi:predicted regulator of Ras-like GTPase activity (Roadblock/LC7/MglB family)
MSYALDGTLQSAVGALKALPGVAGVVVVARDGVVIAHDLAGIPEKEGAVAVYVGNAAAKIGQSLSLSPFRWAVVGIGQETVLVIEQPDSTVGLFLEERASPAMVASRALSALGRDQGSM